jgi:regulator of sigma E protease
MHIAYMILSFLVAIIILVTVHEFGHFYVARRCGVKVLRFSIGFGKVLWRRYDRHGTEFSLSALPFGGYVKMLDEREGEVPPELLDQAFTRKTVWQRMAIVLAGPIANFILAILLFWGLLLQGKTGLIPVVGKVEPGSVAAAASLEVGQEIVAIDGIETPTEQLLAQQLLNRLGESGEITFKVRYPNSTLQYELRTTLDNWLRGVKDPDPVKGLGLELAFPVSAVAGEIKPGSPAERAGFQTGDKIVQADDIQITDWRVWFDYVRAHGGKTIQVKVERADETLALSVTPESFEEKGVSYGRVGMGNQPPPDELFRHYEYSIGGALVASVKETWNTSAFVLISVKKLILGEISTNNLSGPISIAKVAGSSAQIGLKHFIGFLAFLSVLLGVFNLLPIPVLDGGHLVYLAIEAIRGKPVSEKVQIIGYQFGLFLVISLSILAMYNDILRL